MTNRRAIFWAYQMGEAPLEVSSVPWGRIEHVRRLERGDGTCDVVFSFTYEKYQGPTEFRAVPDALACEKLARTLIEAAKS